MPRTLPTPSLARVLGCLGAGPWTWPLFHLLSSLFHPMRCCAPARARANQGADAVVLSPHCPSSGDVPACRGQNAKCQDRGGCARMPGPMKRVASQDSGSDRACASSGQRTPAGRSKIPSKTRRCFVFRCRVVVFLPSAPKCTCSCARPA